MDSCPRLPVPDIRESGFQHSYKQAHRREDSNRLRPPKLRTRYDSNFNRSSSASTTAHAISFRGSSSGIGAENESASTAEALPLQSSAYDSSAEATYFEQCFTRLDKLGEGSFGEVFKVLSKEDGLYYAVKMSKQLFRSENYRQERLEEVRRYEQFSGHENCVRFYRAWEQDDRLYMQMELCRENLESYLERRRIIPEEKIWHILLDLLLALKSLHDRNLIHLDIKLDNVLIGDDNSCKLADFGLVIDVDRANRHQATEGDSRYIAPEIMQGHFSKAADVFSLGIAMLELSCCLELPPNGPLWQQLRSGRLPEDFIKYISTDLQSVIKQMMTPDPKARPTVDQLLSHWKLEALLKRRNRWKLLKKVNQTIRKSRRVAWAKLCNFKKILFHFFTCLLTMLRLYDANANKFEGTETPKPKGKMPTICTQFISSTPSTGSDARARANTDFLMDSNYSDLSQQGTPSNFSTSTDKILNSTPLNHHHSFRSRKDLTKTSFGMVEESTPKSDSRKSNFPSLDDIESHSQSFVRKALDTSSLQGKKLFFKNEDSE